MRSHQTETLHHFLKETRLKKRLSVANSFLLSCPRSPRPHTIHFIPSSLAPQILGIFHKPKNTNIRFYCDPSAQKNKKSTCLIQKLPKWKNQWYARAWQSTFVSHKRQKQLVLGFLSFTTYLGILLRLLINSVFQLQLTVPPEIPFVDSYLQHKLFYK